MNEGLYKDSINRSYYAAFYAVKAVLALSTVDFKRHKDVMGYFNKEYVAKEVFPREIGRKLGTLQRVREKSDYDDFYIASKEKTNEQFQTAELVISVVKKYLEKKINIKALREYMIAVGKNTRHILENITLEQIKSMVSYERVMRILEEGGVTTDFRSVWLLVYWGSLTMGGMILTPMTDHHMMHLPPCLNNLPILKE